MNLSLLIHTLEDARLTMGDCQVMVREAGSLVPVTGIAVNRADESHADIVTIRFLMEGEQP